MENGFLEPETRCGYFISAEYKKLWSIEMECYQQIAQVCERHNLRFFVGGGTLLGAVRHQGFIPWDDDMDVFMPEDDYIQFLQWAPKEIKEPFFYQSYKSQPGYSPCMSRVRKSGTTAATQRDLRNIDNNYHFGVFTDVICLSSVAEKGIKRFCQMLKVRFYIKAITGFQKIQRLKATGRFGAKSFFSRSVLAWTLINRFLTYDEMCDRYMKICSARDSSQYSLHMFLGRRIDKYTWPKEWWTGGAVMLPFEDIMVRCPKEYDKVLTRQFGNYREFQKGTALHGLEVMNPYRPYQEVLAEYYASKKETISGMH